MKMERARRMARRESSGDSRVVGATEDIASEGVVMAETEKSRGPAGGYRRRGHVVAPRRTSDEVRAAARPRGATRKRKRQPEISSGETSEARVACPRVYTRWAVPTQMNAATEWGSQRSVSSPAPTWACSLYLPLPLFSKE